jgi:hypothetical protein
MVWYSPREVVKRRVDRLLGVMSFEKGESRMARQGGVYGLSALLGAEVELACEDHPEANGLFDKRQLEEAYTWLVGHVELSQWERVSFESVKEVKQFFEVVVVVDGEIRLADSKPMDGRYRVFLVWEKDDAGWYMRNGRRQGRGSDSPVTGSGIDGEPGKGWYSPPARGYSAWIISKKSPVRWQRSRVRGFAISSNWCRAAMTSSHWAWASRILLRRGISAKPRFIR